MVSKIRLISEYEPSKRMMIDVESLFNCYTCYHMQNGQCNTFCDAGESYRPDINKLEIIEAEPVRHGQWKFVGLDETLYADIYKCSRCSRKITVSNNHKKTKNVVSKLFPYCHCGTKMAR